MKLLLIRHGDPDYDHDTLTKKGEREAILLAERMAKTILTEIYVSPLGRAQKTASYSLEKMGRSAQTLDWLREFDGTSIRPDIGHETLAWDWLPQDWTAEERFYDKDHWMEPKAMADATAPERYKWVISQFDAFLADHGYVREGNLYRVVKPNNDTIAFFCHFGLSCVLLSHLIGVSPMVLWHGMMAAPTSVTTVSTEERREGIASFRINAYGDVSHLLNGGEPVAFSGRFCECFQNAQERRD